ncbi:hypothetical protein CHARACLAT_004893 [Characodon lateralis]|uniref:Uncharacterized protein n=1 Tax=Characodon lateralis TaxID=208331 RepID=A0ABU7DDU0_9TELE|nr:hypothetical protein [Characodon lateralis]
MNRCLYNIKILKRRVKFPTKSQMRVDLTEQDGFCRLFLPQSFQYVVYSVQTTFCSFSTSFPNFVTFKLQRFQRANISDLVLLLSSVFSEFAFLSFCRVLCLHTCCSMHQSDECVFLTLQGLNLFALML